MQMQVHIHTTHVRKFKRGRVVAVCEAHTGVSFIGDPGEFQIIIPHPDYPASTGVRWNKSQPKDAWPPIAHGTWVRTTEENVAMRKEWLDEKRSSEKWGVDGEVVNHHDAHGLCYEVKHRDGTIGIYDPSEFEVL